MIVTSRPLACDGATSAIYLDSENILALCSYPRRREIDQQGGDSTRTANCKSDNAPADNHPPYSTSDGLDTAPNANRISATSMTLRRPYLSARTPIKGLAINANRLVHDVMRLSSSVVNGRLDRSEPIVTRVEEMTPVLLIHKFINHHHCVTVNSIDILVSEKKAADTS